MSAAHSPAPFDDEGGRTNCVYDATGHIVADCSDAASGERDSERRAANAHLFASAPDLLAVCERLVNDDDIPQGYGGLYAHLQKLRDLARPAIAKATGGAE